MTGCYKSKATMSFLGPFVTPCPAWLLNGFLLHIDPRREKGLNHDPSSSPSKLQREKRDGFLICFYSFEELFYVCWRQRFRTASMILALIQTTTICYLLPLLLSSAKKSLPPLQKPSILFRKTASTVFPDGESVFFFEKYRKKI